MGFSFLHLRSSSKCLKPKLQLKCFLRMQVKKCIYQINDFEFPPKKICKGKMSVSSSLLEALIKCDCWPRREVGHE